VRLALHRARAATDTDPTHAQKDAGNYKKGDLYLHGLHIKIENPKGSVRRGIGAGGKPWETRLVADYGYIKRVHGDTARDGADGDKVDVFIGPDLDSELVYVVDQHRADGKTFDEHKAVLATRSEEQARALYLANYSPGWQGLGAIHALTIDQFKQWLADGKLWKPIRPSVRLVFKAARLGTPQLGTPQSGTTQQMSSGTPRGDTEAGGVRPGLFRRLVGHLRRVLVKAERREVRKLGSRGGRWYVTSTGHIRYGEAPEGSTAFTHATSRVHVARVTRRKSGLFAGTAIATAADTAAVFRNVTDLDRERFWLLHLKQSGQPLAVEIVSQGSLSASIVHPREVFKNALKIGTAALAFIHNHPSGDPRPSREDLQITAQLKRVADLVGVPVLDHVVVGRQGYVAIASDGSVSDRHEWAETEAAAGRELSTVEGRIRPEASGISPLWSEWTEEPIQYSASVARIGAQLLDPGDKVALLLVNDNKNVLMGVYPVAHDQIDATTVAEVVKLAIASSAASVVVVAGKDGPEWTSGVDRLHHALSAPMMDAGIRYLDTVSVGEEGRFRSAGDDGSVEWP